MSNENCPSFQEANAIVALFTEGRYQEAAALAQVMTVRFPLHAFGWIVLGEVYKQLGQSANALSHMQKAVALSPDNPEAHANLGNFLQGLGQHEQAAGSYRMALQIKPDYVEAYFNLGVALQELDRLAEAEICYRQALQIKPDYAEAHSNLGNTLKELGRLNEAELCFRQALLINPESAELHNNLGVILKDLGRLHEAGDSFRQALRIQPDFAGAHNNLGVTFKESGHLHEAEECYRRALQIQPDYAEAHTNLAITLLARGDLTAGWEENEWRWATPQMRSGRRDFAQPLWRGERAEGLTLLIHAEQGYGDTLQFCRYASIAAARGLRVILEVPMPLVKLLRSLTGVERVVGSGEELPAFDLHCPMLSMPWALKTSLSTIPCAASYLQADKERVYAWRTRLAALPNSGRRIGLVWAGNSHTHWPQAAIIDRQRSLPPERLAPLFELSGFHFFSLQKGGAAVPENFPLTDFMDEMEDFADTAALIANLDLVIAVDTAVAHLAAALGKPVWVLNRFDACWRWLRERQDSPWYPSVQLFGQPQPGDWQTVIRKVAEELPLFTEKY